MKALTLPSRNNGEPLRLPENLRKAIIIGANGAGKTRFARAMATSLGNQATTISALDGIFPRSQEPTIQNHIDRLYASKVTSSEAIDTPRKSQLEKLFALLMHDEMANLLRYKFERTTNDSATLDETRLDRLIEIWSELFPANRILVESGKLLFSRGIDPTLYPSLRLSTGEKATLFYIASILYAPRQSVIFIDNPDLFLHPTLVAALWNRLELERPDCLLIYITHDLEFAGSRTGATTVWVRDCDVATGSWDYDILPSRQELPDEVYMAILGSRKPIIFIEGDAEHSIDAKFYPLIFSAYTVRSMGSCNKVIEATRAFNDLTTFHHLDSHGIVDRDRRDEKEVEYLRRKKIFVPDVAEIENILMLEEVVRTVAEHCGKDADAVFARVRHTIMEMFRAELYSQALQHTRHRMKRFMECRIDGRFTDIDMLERHLNEVTKEFDARGLYESYCSDFKSYLERNDYQMVLRVFNQKSMVPVSGVAGLCGMTGGKEQYVATILSILRHGGRQASRIRQAVLRCFGITPEGEADNAPAPAEPLQPAEPPKKKKRWHTHSHPRFNKGKPRR